MTPIQHVRKTKRASSLAARAIQPPKRLLRISQCYSSYICSKCRQHLSSSYQQGRGDGSSLAASSTHAQPGQEKTGSKVFVQATELRLLIFKCRPEGTFALLPAARPIFQNRFEGWWSVTTSLHPLSTGRLRHAARAAVQRASPCRRRC